MEKDLEKQNDLVWKAVKNSGIRIPVLAEKLGMSRATLYNKFKEIPINKDFVRKLGKEISYDFSKEFPELAKEKQELIDLIKKESKEHQLPELPFLQVAEPFGSAPTPPKDCETELKNLQRDYIALSNYTILLLHERLTSR